jgi:hypothetical protein
MEPTNLGAISMPKTLGGDEPGYLGFAMVDDLLSVLVSKEVITTRDVDSMLAALTKRLDQEGTVLGKRCAEFLADRMASKP